jgi:hypothetical protein
MIMHEQKCEQDQSHRVINQNFCHSRMVHQYVQADQRALEYKQLLIKVYRSMFSMSHLIFTQLTFFLPHSFPFISET